MTWKITSRIDNSRWLECSDGLEFTADPLTAGALFDLPSYEYMLTPTGPTQRGITTPSHLFGAAWQLIPAPIAEGDTPPYPTIPSIPGLIY